MGAINSVLEDAARKRRIRHAQQYSVAQRKSAVQEPSTRQRNAVVNPSPLNELKKLYEKLDEVNVKMSDAKAKVTIKSRELQVAQTALKEARKTFVDLSNQINAAHAGLQQLIKDRSTVVERQGRSAIDAAHAGVDESVSSQSHVVEEEGESESESDDCEASDCSCEKHRY